MKSLNASRPTFLCRIEGGLMHRTRTPKIPRRRSSPTKPADPDSTINFPSSVSSAKPAVPGCTSSKRKAIATNALGVADTRQLHSSCREISDVIRAVTKELLQRQWSNPPHATFTAATATLDKRMPTRLQLAVKMFQACCAHQYDRATRPKASRLDGAIKHARPRCFGKDRTEHAYRHDRPRIPLGG